MLINIDGLDVIFPYDYIYPEQYRYMYELKASLKAGGSCILEMPSGTGKTVSLLSLTIAYVLKYPLEYSKIVYCSRTISEIEKVMDELKNLYNYYEKKMKIKLKMCSLCLSSRKNLCINEQVINTNYNDGKSIDLKCYQLTANNELENTSCCKYFENFEIESQNYILPYGVYSLEDLKTIGYEKNFCPYFTARNAISTCQILVYSYYYLLDPKVAQIVSKELPQNSIIIFDEGHNIDNVCIDSLSVKLTQRNINECRESLLQLENTLKEIRLNDEKKLIEEYHTMLENIRQQTINNQNDLYLTNPIIPQDILEELIPGNIRKADHFISFLKRFVEYLQFRLNNKNVTTESPYYFLKDVYDKV